MGAHCCLIHTTPTDCRMIINDKVTERDPKNQNSNHLLNDKGSFGTYNGKVNFAAEFKRDPDHSNIASFISAIANDHEPYISKEELVRSMEVCFAIDKSIKIARPVNIL